MRDKTNMTTNERIAATFREFKNDLNCSDEAAAALTQSSVLERLRRDLVGTADTVGELMLTRMVLGTLSRAIEEKR